MRMELEVESPQISSRFMVLVVDKQTNNKSTFESPENTTRSFAIFDQVCNVVNTFGIVYI